MDGNRDDALRCEAIGKEAMRVQDFSKALKFFQKSLRLYPSDNVSAMMQQAQAGLEGKGGAGEEDNGVRKRSPKEGRSGNGTSGMASASASASQPAVSAEHLELVRRVRRSSSYYEILEVSRTCSDEDIRKAYRKLSLKVHPDKNKAPGAEEAFKAVSKAFQCLSDTDLRSNYDQFGHEDPQAMAQQRQRNAHAQRQRHRGLDDDFDPNDIFNAFFGGNGVMNDHFNGRMFRAQFGGAHQPRNPSGGGPRGAGGNNNVGVLPLLQLLPLLAIFLYALLPAAEPVYKLDRSEGYQVERTTSGWNIPYFVKPGEFDGKYPVGTRDRRRLEQAVEQEYRETAETRCYHERVQQAQLYRWGQAQKARDLAMPFCEELRRLQRAW